MTTSRRTIAKNASVMMGSQLITWAMALLLALYLPRYLQPEALGQFAIAGSIWAIVGVFLTFGMDTHLTKSIARDPTTTADLVATSLVIRTVLFVLGGIVVWAYLQVFDFGVEVRLLSIALGLMTYGGIIMSCAVAALGGIERMEYISLATILMKVIITGLSFLCIFLKLSVYWIAAVNTVGIFVGAAVALVALLRFYPIAPRIHTPAFWSMLRLSAPYLVTGTTLVVYQQVDQLFIANLVDAKAVGYYSTAQTLLGTLMFLPSVFGTVIFPVLARSHAAGRDHMDMMVRRSLDLMLLVSIPIGLGLVVTAEPLVLLVYGKAFQPTGLILSVLGIVCIFTYLNTLLGYLLISMDRTARLNVVMLVAIAVTLPLDLVLVPWCEQMFQNGALGGALSFLITEFGMLALSLLLLPRNTLTWNNVRSAALIAVAGFAMVAVTLLLRDRMVLVAIPVGAAVYIGVIVGLRVVAPDDWLILRQAGQVLLARIRQRGAATAQVIGD